MTSDQIDKPAPTDTPLSFNPFNTANVLMHAGSFSHDLKNYYLTISDPNFEQFDIYTTQFQDGKWKGTEKAFFNSDYNDHGAKFSPEGRALYFASTRPTGVPGIADTWHLWRSELKDNQWSDPEFLNIPGLENKLASHPSISKQGTLFFHVSNPDYSEMSIYSAMQKDGQFIDPKPFPPLVGVDYMSCTPFVAPDESYLLFARIGTSLDLMISRKGENGKWSNPVPLNEKVNQQGQGNPYVTPDGKYLFYTTGSGNEGWKVNWILKDSALD